MLKAQKKDGKSPRDKSLVAPGGDQRWGFCLTELFPTQWTLVLRFQCLFCCTFWEENGISLQGCCCGWIHALPMNVSEFLHLISARLCWQMTAVFYLLSHQGAAHPQQEPLCQRPTSMAALSPGSQPPGSHLHKRILCHSETPVLLWGTHYSTISSLFLEFQNRGLRVFPHFLLLLFWQSKL